MSEITTAHEVILCSCDPGATVNSSNQAVVILDTQQFSSADEISDDSYSLLYTRYIKDL